MSDDKDKVTNFVFDSFDLADENLPTWDGEGAGPPDDIENDPAYDPDDPELKGIKGG